MRTRKSNYGKKENHFIDLASPITEIDISTIKNHRSCWLHIVGCQYGNKHRITKQDIERLRHFELTSPCFLQTLCTRVRSNRKPGMKKAKIRQTKKLDTNEFQDHLEKLWRSFSDDKKTSCAYLDCLWFPLYLEASTKDKVLTWIKKKHIFSKKYVFIPIVCWGHWSLLILCHFGETSESKDRTPCMLLLDSLEMTGPRRLEPNIRKFILDIYKAEGKLATKKSISTIPLLLPKVPQQHDDVECGNFVLYYISLFMQLAPENFSIHDGYPYFMVQDWFSDEGLESFCQKLDSSMK